MQCPAMMRDGSNFFLSLNMANMSTSKTKTLLVRAPSKLLSNGVVTHIEDSRSSVNIELAQSQWKAYADTFLQKGWNVETVPPQEDCPDGVFIEDAVVYFSRPLIEAEEGSSRGLMLLCRAGHPSREEERKTVQTKVNALQINANGSEFSEFDIEEIKEPGTLDGGDVLKIEKESIIYVGRGGRTNASGIAQLRQLLTARGYTVVAVPMTKALHLSK